MTTKALGEEGFRWFVGVVEDRDDPLMLGRLRVRVYNMHSEFQSRTSTSELPWAYAMNTVNGANQGQVGHSPTGIQVGSTVIGFFMDGNDGNVPVIMGSLAGIPGKDVNKHDVPFEARETNKVQKTLVGPEPASAYSAKYPYNKVIRTERGHVIEIDDTPGKERFHAYHKSGTYVEINNEGRVVIKSVSDSYEIVTGNKEVFVDGNYTINVTGDVVINGRTINLNRGTMGAARIGDTADTGDAEHAEGSNVIESGSGTVFIGD